MHDGKNPPAIFEAGEYGATTVYLSKDGSMFRLAFGRNREGGAKTFHGAVLLSPEAFAELKSQIGDLDN